MAKRGRKPVYSEERVKIITRIIADGGTYKDAYEAAGISHNVFYNWKNEINEFKEALEKAERDYDENLVNDAKAGLRKLVRGYTYDEVTTETYPDKSGKQQTKKKVIQKHIAPNPTAIIFTLTNRDPENWKNRQTNEISGDLKTTMETKVDLSKLPDELLSQVLEKLDEPNNE